MYYVADIEICCVQESPSSSLSQQCGTHLIFHISAYFSQFTGFTILARPSQPQEPDHSTFGPITHMSKPCRMGVSTPDPSSTTGSSFGALCAIVFGKEPYQHLLFVKTLRIFLPCRIMLNKCAMQCLFVCHTIEKKTAHTPGNIYSPAIHISLSSH